MSQNGNGRSFGGDSLDAYELHIVSQVCGPEADVIYPAGRRVDTFIESSLPRSEKEVDTFRRNHPLEALFQPTVSIMRGSAASLKTKKTKRETIRETIREVLHPLPPIPPRPSSPPSPVLPSVPSGQVGHDLLRPPLGPLTIAPPSRHALPSHALASCPSNLVVPWMRKRTQEMTRLRR